MPTFYRNAFSELWITLSSNEVLGVLDSDYIEDYFGVDGQITVRHESGTPYTVLMNAVPEDTPSIPNDVFTGFLDLPSVPDGLYTIQGRVRDVIGNYTILNEVETPFGGENVMTITFIISSDVFGTTLVVYIGPVTLTGGFSFTAPFATEPEIEMLWEEPSIDMTFFDGITLETSPTDIVFDDMFFEAPDLDAPMVTELELEMPLLGE